jgi:hypothetical protein
LNRTANGKNRRAVDRVLATGSAARRCFCIAASAAA